MLKKLLDHKIDVVLFVFLVLLLASIRAFENELFYDPFLSFFRSEFNNKPLPMYDGFLLFVNLLFRYVLNTLISLVIIYVIFKDKALVKFASVLYVIFFLLLIIALFMVLFLLETKSSMTLFYIRRFIIQPLFVLLFVPAFYYQNRMSKK